MKRKRIGMISFGTDPWSLQFCLGAVAAAEDRGCDLHTYRHPIWSGEQHLDALVLASQPTSMLMATIKRTVQRGVPLVCVVDGVEELSTVSPDNRAGMELGVKHLASHGHRRILYLMGFSLDSEQRCRLQGYKDGLAASGLEFDPSLVLSHNQINLTAARQSVLEALARNLEFTAVLASTDWAAMGAIEALRISGRKVPEDVAVVGFDNFESQARRSDPPLSSVTLPLYDVGYRALEMALEKGESSSNEITHERLPMHLCARASCGCGNRSLEDYRCRDQGPAHELAHELFARPVDLGAQEFQALAEEFSAGMAAGQDVTKLVAGLMRRGTSLGLDAVYCHNFPLLLRQRLEEVRQGAGGELAPERVLGEIRALCARLASRYPAYVDNLRDEFRAAYDELRLQVVRLPDEPSIINCIRRCMQRGGFRFFGIYLPSISAPETDIDVWEWQASDGETMHRRKMYVNDFSQADLMPDDGTRRSAFQIGLFGDGFPGHLVVDMDSPYFPWLADLVHCINITIQSSRNHQVLQQRTKELEVTRSLLELAVGDRRKMTVELEEARRQLEAMNTRPHASAPTSV